MEKIFVECDGSRHRFFAFQATLPPYIAFSNRAFPGENFLYITFIL